MRQPARRLGEILVLGDVNTDIIARVKSWPEPGEECLTDHLEWHCGGVGANGALALRRWGISARLLACVGKDVFGERLLQTLAENGVNIRNVQRTAEAMTGLLYINVMPRGQRTFFGSRGANCLVRLPRNALPLYRGAAGALLMGYNFLDSGPENAARRIMRAIHARGGWVALDVGVEPSRVVPRKIMGVLKDIDLLFVSSDEAAALTGTRDARESCRRFQKAGARQVVVKTGKAGCLVLGDGALRRVPSFPVRAVDSTGAGDAFTAAFLHAKLRGWPIAEAALVANAAGAVSVGKIGAGENLPSLGEVKLLLRAHRLKHPWEDVRSRVLTRSRLL